MISRLCALSDGESTAGSSGPEPRAIIKWRDLTDRDRFKKKKKLEDEGFRQWPNLPTGPR